MCDGSSSVLWMSCALVAVIVTVGVIAVHMSSAPFDQEAHDQYKITPRCLNALCLVSGGCKRSECASETLGCGYFNMTRAYFQECKFCWPSTINSEENLTSAWRQCSNQRSCADCCVVSHLDQLRFRRQIFSQERDQCKTYSRQYFRSVRVRTDSQEIIDFVRRVDDTFAALS